MSVRVTRLLVLDYHVQYAFLIAILDDTDKIPLLQATLRMDKDIPMETRMRKVEAIMDKTGFFHGSEHGEINFETGGCQQNHSYDNPSTQFRGVCPIRQVWGILIGISFFMVNNDQEVAQNKGGLLFFFTTNFTFAFSFGNTSVLPNDFPILLKEYRVGMYGIASYLWSIILMNIPKIVVLVFVQLLLSYFLTGLFAGSMTGSVPTANALNAPLIMPFFLFGGLYQNDNSTPYWFYPVKYLSWIRYSWNALMVNEFADMRVIECNDDTAGFDCIYTDGKQILSIYGIQETIWFPNVVCNLFLGLLLSLLSLMCLWRRTRKL
eukprot:sb/3466850/